MEGVNPLLTSLNSHTHPAKQIQNEDKVSQLATEVLKKGTGEVSDQQRKVAVSETKQQTTIAGFPVSIDKKTLDVLAIKEGYGYKTANLMLLEREVAKINPKLQNGEVRVPPFIGITDATIHAYLQHALPELIPLWSSFLESFDQKDKEQFLNNPNQSTIHLSPQGMEILLQIQKKIETHFSAHDFENDQLTEWIKNNPSSHLMVRSTGKEDTDENSNAGGNESVASVLPDSRSLSLALGKVISSYFGAKSVTQRLSLGDTSVFTEPKPFVPVLFQVMIGEETNNIPRSGVMFTSQHYLSPGITMFQTGLGHNEGIVGSKVDVDSYFVDHKHQVHSVIRHKKSRVKDGVEVPNDPKLQTLPALSREAAVNMKIVADHLQDSLGKPLDIEYTIKKEGSKDIIYLLQNRPLVKPENEPQPSYINFDRFGSRVVTGSVLPSSDTKVLRMNHKEQIIFADNILKALDIYNDPKTDRSKIKAVIINAPTSSSSHPAVFLHAKELPIFVVENKNDFQALTKAKAWTLDVQQGILIPNNCPEELVCKGYISYPIPREATIEIPPIAKARLIAAKESDPAKKARLERFIQREIATLNAEVPAMIQGLSAGQPLLTVNTIRSLLRQLALQDKDQAKLALATLIDYFSKNVSASLRIVEPGRKDAQFAKWMVYETLISLAKNEIIPALENHPPQSLERLYPLKFLEALILQSASKSVVGGFSFGLSALTDKKEKVALKEAQKISPSQKLTSSQYIALNWKKDIYRKDVQEKWVSYVSMLSDQDAEQLVNDLQDIQKFGFLSDWLNIRFPFSESPAEELRKEIGENRALMEELETIVAQADRFEKNIDEWSDPNYAQRHTQEIMKTMRDLFDHLEKNYRAAGWMGKMAILGVEFHLVDVYDRTIKAVTGSAKYPDGQKLHVFQQLLQGYRSLLEKTSGEGRPPGGGSFGAEFTNFHSFLQHLDEKKLENLKKLTKQPNPFEVRRGFEVGPLTLSYKGLRGNIMLPITEEEFFTVYHQNLMNAINLRKADLGMKPQILPLEVQRILPLIDRGELSYIGTENDQLHIIYNVNSITSHSATYKLIFDLKHPEKGFELQFSMTAIMDGARFAELGSLGALLFRTGSLDIGELPVKYSAQGVSFSIKVPPKESLPELFEKLNALVEKAVEGKWGFDPKTIDFRKIKEEAFSDSLHLNHRILVQAAADKDWNLVAVVSKQTLLGLANRGWPDYLYTTGVYADDKKDGSANPELKGILGNFKSIPGNVDGKNTLRSLTLEAGLYLVRCLKERGQAAQAARQAIEDLSETPAAQEKFKNLIHALKLEIKSLG